MSSYQTEEESGNKMSDSPAGFAKQHKTGHRAKNVQRIGDLQSDQPIFPVVRGKYDDGCYGNEQPNKVPSNEGQGLTYLDQEDKEKPHVQQNIK